MTGWNSIWRRRSWAGGTPTASRGNRSFPGWMMTGFRVLAALRRLRGTIARPVLRTAGAARGAATARRYEGDLDRILDAIDARRLDAAAALASVPQLIRGYGHVKLASVARADAERDRLLPRLVRPEAEPIAAE